jgi:hypothetical protein
MGLRTSLDGYGKSRPHRDSIPGPSIPVASRYTNWATPGQNCRVRYCLRGECRTVTVTSLHHSVTPSAKLTMVWCGLYSGNFQKRFTVNFVPSFNKCNIYSSIIYSRKLACTGSLSLSLSSRSLSLSESYASELNKGQFLWSDLPQSLHYSSSRIRDTVARYRIRSQTPISTAWFFSCSGAGSYVPELAQRTGRLEPFVTMFSKVGTFRHNVLQRLEPFVTIFSKGWNLSSQCSPKVGTFRHNTLQRLEPFVTMLSKAANILGF